MSRPLKNNLGGFQEWTHRLECLDHPDAGWIETGRIHAGGDLVMVSYACYECGAPLGSAVHCSVCLEQDVDPKHSH